MPIIRRVNVKRFAWGLMLTIAHINVLQLAQLHLLIMDMPRNASLLVRIILTQMIHWGDVSFPHYALEIRGEIQQVKNVLQIVHLIISQIVGPQLKCAFNYAIRTGTLTIRQNNAYQNAQSETRLTVVIRQINAYRSARKVNLPRIQPVCV